MPIKLSEACSQVVLYSKNHFVHGDLIEDVRILLAYRNGINDPRDLSEYDIVLSLLAIMEDCQCMPNISTPGSSWFISTVIFGGQYGRPVFQEDNQGAFLNFVKAVMTALHQLQVRDGDSVLIELHPINRTLLAHNVDVPELYHKAATANLVSKPTHHDVRKAVLAYRRNVREPGDCKGKHILLAALAIAETDTGHYPGWLPTTQALAVRIEQLVTPASPEKASVSNGEEQSSGTTQDDSSSQP